MPFDFGFYNSLRAKDDLAQKRLDEQVTLGIATQIKNDAQLKAQQNMASLVAIQDYYNQTGKETSNLLDQDAARVSAAAPTRQIHRHRFIMPSVASKLWVSGSSARRCL